MVLNVHQAAGKNDNKIPVIEKFLKFQSDEGAPTQNSAEKAEFRTMMQNIQLVSLSL